MLRFVPLQLPASAKATKATKSSQRARNVSTSSYYDQLAAAAAVSGAAGDGMLQQQLLSRSYDSRLLALGLQAQQRMVADSKQSPFNI